MKTADDPLFQALADTHGRAAADAKELGGDLGTAGRYAAAEEALAAYVDAKLADCRDACALLVNDQLALQHLKMSRMEEALRKITGLAHLGNAGLLCSIAAAGLT